MVRPAALFALIVTVAGVAAADEPPETDVVRLPGQGEMRAPPNAGENRQRLVPGGGLLLSFDIDDDGLITDSEIETGIVEAFGDADANGNGSLTALEQQAWAASLPTRDESLANPVRFDPNLDRSVSPDEFSQVITSLADGYRNSDSGELRVEDLRTTVRPVENERPASLRELAARRNGL